MLDVQTNETLCRTGPGTPMGEVLRRYWHPVALSDDVTPGSKPKQLKIMSEDLVLFRDDDGRPGLLGLRCSHRLTSLAYGRVEDGGIRCPFHGWLYDVNGRCLQQPGEPPESTFKDKVRHPAYPCRDSGGLIFAYMGPPERQPPLPPFEVLVSEEGSRHASGYAINSNYLQNLEGALDHTHVPFLHAQPWSERKHSIIPMSRDTLIVVETDFGLQSQANHAEQRRQHRQGYVGEDQEGMPDETNSSDYRYNYLIMPAGFARLGDTRGLESGSTQFQSWYVPADDEHTLRFMVAFIPLSFTGGEPYEFNLTRVPPEEVVVPGPWNDYLRNYEEVDTISGIPFRTGAEKVGLKGFQAQDGMANETGGPIVDRSKEHLGVGDRVIIKTRQMLLGAVEDVRAGRDPRSVEPRPAEDGLVHIKERDEEGASVR